MRSEDRRWSSLRHGFDTRKDPGINRDFAEKELGKTFKNRDEIIDSANDYPIVCTEDGMITKSRAYSYLLYTTLATATDPDPLIPVRVLIAVTFDDLDNDEYCELLGDSMEADIIDTKQRGLKDADIQSDIEKFYAKGWRTVDKIKKVCPSVPEWKIKRNLAIAKNKSTQALVQQGREEREKKLARHEAVNYFVLAENLGLGAQGTRENDKYARLISNEQQRGGAVRNTAGLTALKKKQVYSSQKRAKRFAESNQWWYETSVTGNPRRLPTKKFPLGEPRTRKMTEDTFIAITDANLDEARNNLAFWENVKQRADTLVAKNKAARATLKRR